MNSDHHRRRSIRLPEYDYTQPGAYFVTICTHQRECLFGEVMEGEMRLSVWGEVAEQCWRDIPAHFPHVELDAWVVVPNHIHGIITITDVVGAQHAAPLQPPRINVRPGSLGAIVRSYKSAVTKRINELRGTPGAAVWQRNYWEHIIRTERALEAIRRYIAENPLRWELDRYNPETGGRDPRAVELWRMLQDDARAMARQEER